MVDSRNPPRVLLTKKCLADFAALPPCDQKDVKEFLQNLPSCKNFLQVAKKYGEIDACLLLHDGNWRHAWRVGGVCRDNGIYVRVCDASNDAEIIVSYIGIRNANTYQEIGERVERLP